jgi:signal transduction histidine kinase
MEDDAVKLDASGKTFIERIRAANHRISQLIDDLLNLARVTRGDLRQEVVDLSAMAKSVMANLQKDDPQRVVEVVV